MPMTESDALGEKAERKLEEIMKLYPDIPKGERMHTDYYIFPAAAIYLAVKEKKGEYRMDVTACPYNKYLTVLGCPELTKIFCANDERCYGNLPGLEFICVPIWRRFGRQQIFVRPVWRIAEQGKHEELAAKNGPYSRMLKDYNRAIKWKISSTGEAK